MFSHMVQRLVLNVGMIIVCLKNATKPIIKKVTAYI